MVKLTELKGKRVLVTGGCGFIGLNLVSDLVKHGAKVSVLDLEGASWSSLPEGVEKKVADILDKRSLIGTFDNIEIIYHLAARTDIDGKHVEDYEVNYVGTKNVLRESTKKPGLNKFVFYSTQLVVGLFNETRFITEDEPYRTNTKYGESKILGEKVVIKECTERGINYTIIRPTSVYGPWGKSPYKEFFKTIESGRYFHVGKASNLVSWVYVKNLTGLTILSSLSADSRNNILFGNDLHPYTMREIVDQVSSYYGVKIRTIPNYVVTPIAYMLGVLKLLGFKSVPIYPFRLKNIKCNYCYDIKKSIALGYLPSYGLRDGLRETLDWYKKHGI